MTSQEGFPGPAGATQVDVAGRGLVGQCREQQKTPTASKGANRRDFKAE
jgi:hypothetical protein